MLRLLSRVALGILFIWLTQAHLAHAQQVREVNRVISLVENKAENLAILSTSLAKPVSPPLIQYFPGGDGETLMVCDFPGVLWTSLPRVLASPVAGLSQVRFGQFQNNPPIFRIAITTTKPALLRSLAFRATAGSLVIKWPCVSVTASSSLSYGVKPKGAALLERRIESDLRGAGGTPASEHARCVRSQGVVVKEPHVKPNATALDCPQPAPQTLAMSAHPQIAPMPTRTLPARQASSRPSARSFSPVSPSFVPPEPISSALKALSIHTDTACTSYNEAIKPLDALKETPALALLHETSGKLGEKTDCLVPTCNRSHTLVGARCDAPADDSRAVPTYANSCKSVLDPAPQLTVKGTNPVRVTLTGPTPFLYHSFRLNDPERYVVDVEGLPLAPGYLETVEPNGFLRSVRIGSSDSNRTRIVLDIVDKDVEVKEIIGPGELVVVVGKSANVAESVHLPAGLSVVLDPGHGGNDPGAQRGNIQEKDLTLAIVDKLKKSLEEQGVKVSVTRSDDSAVSLEERVRLTNSSSPDAFISVHINSLETNSAIYGIETYYQTEHSKELAHKLHESLVGRLAAPDRSTRKARFYVINHTPVPAVLAEVGFISNKEEREKLISSDYQRQVANALARGVILYLSRESDVAQSLGKNVKAPANNLSTPDCNEGPSTKTTSLAEASVKVGHQARPLEHKKQEFSPL